MLEQIVPRIANIFCRFFWKIPPRPRPKATKSMITDIIAAKARTIASREGPIPFNISVISGIITSENVPNTAEMANEAMPKPECFSSTGPTESTITPLLNELSFVRWASRSPPSFFPSPQVGVAYPTPACSSAILTHLLRNAIKISDDVP